MTLRIEIGKLNALLLAVVMGLLGIQARADEYLAETVQPVCDEAKRTELLSVLADLKKHTQGKLAMDVKALEAHKGILDQHAEHAGCHPDVIKACFDLVTTYDAVHGPLFVARGEWDKGHRRNRTPIPFDIHWTMYHVMQHIFDTVYTPVNIERYTELLDGFKFGSSAHFPGPVDPPGDAEEIYKVKVDARSPVYVTYEKLGGPRRPTGAYVAPGSIVTVRVPESLVNKSYQVRVGAHSWDNSVKRRVTRLARVSLLFDVDRPEIRVAHPLGGGIYLEVPEGADDGIVELVFKNAVRSPYFSATSFDKTSQQQWLDIERKRRAPWADFHSDKFMMQVPTMWISNLEDPVQLMADWDTAMDVMNDLFGQPRIKSRHTMYLQVDLQNRGRAFFPGYPTCNDRYDPNKADEYGGYANHYLVRGPQVAPNYVFHEQGHAFNIPKYPGERESAVNLPHVAIWHQEFGYSLDHAFAASRGHVDDDVRTLDRTAITWMCSSNFTANLPMKNYEKQYQLKGHAKYVDIARMFGWQVLGKYWKAFNEEVAEGVYKGRHSYSNDEITLRKCRAVGVDLRPLVRFWGIHEDDADALAESIAEEEYPPSAKIYDTLVHYKSLVPENNAAFRKFALLWWGKQPSIKGFTTERNHAARWTAYDAKEAALIRKTVQQILDQYFPNGRPAENT